MNFNFKGVATKLGVSAVGSAIGFGFYKLAEDGICRLSNRIVRRKAERDAEKTARLEKKMKKEGTLLDKVKADIPKKERKERKEKDPE